MKQIFPDSSWPESWLYSYPYDLMEVYNQCNKSNLGYAYAYSSRKKNTLSLLTGASATGSSVLDIAAAQGNFSLTLAEMNYKVTWNDLRSDLAGYVQTKYERGVIEYAPGNVFELKFPQLFDVVLITEIIEHVAHPDEFLSKVAELVKPGGHVIMTTPNGGYFKNRLPKFSESPDPSVFEAVQFKPDSDGHIFLLHQEEVYKLAHDAGLLVDELILFTNPLTNGHIKLGHVLKILPKRFVFLVEALSQFLPPLIKRKLMVQMGVRLRKSRSD